MSLNTIEELIAYFVPDGFRDDDGVWHEGPHRQNALGQLGVLRERLQRAETALRDAWVEAETQPLEIDISDYGDEWVAGFLAGQVNALEFLERRAALGPEEAATTVAREISKEPRFSALEHREEGQA